jgi:hypothetical protein
MTKDYNKIAKIEKAIKQKYGDEAVNNPANGWTAEKESDYLNQIKELAKKDKGSKEQASKECYYGFFIQKKLLNKESNRNCPVCDTYSFELRDDIYLGKWQCCYKCYVSYVEGREGRWKQGWRPGD